MKNKEKFKDELVNIICIGDSIAIDKETHTPIVCSDIKCSNCLFYTVKMCCSDALVEWANQEYKKPDVISVSDHFFLSYIKDGFEYLARDKDGRLYAHAIKPKKYKEYGMWIGMDSINVFKFNVDFPMIKWSDNQPCKISDLKELKVVEKY